MTENHNYGRPSKGTADWHIPLNENFDQIDADVEIRDVKGRLTEYTPRDGAKFLATDTGQVFTGDGDSWQQIGSISEESTITNKLNNVAYASSYEGDTLDVKIKAALDDLPNGSGRVVVPPKGSGEAWQWKHLDLDPTAYNGIHIDVTGGAKVRFSDDGYAMTVKSNGDISSQLHGSTISLTGGYWIADGAPSGFIRAIDIIWSRFEPRVVTGFTNGSNDSTIYTVEADQKWCEKNTFGGNVHSCDIGLEFVADSDDSMVDNTVTDFSVGAHNTGMILRGILGGVQFSNFVFFPRSDGATGVLLDDWNLHGCQFDAPRFDNPNGFNNTTAFKSTEAYQPPGPTIYEPRMSSFDVSYDPGGTESPLYALLAQQSDFHIANLHPDGGSAVFGPKGRIAVYDNTANEVFAVDSNGNVVTGGDQKTGSPTVFNDGLKIPPKDLLQTSPKYAEVSYHDGSGDFSRSLCFFVREDTWYNVIDGKTMPISG